MVECNEICDELKGKFDYLFGAIDAARNDGYGSDEERDKAYESLIKIANVCGLRTGRDSFGVPFLNI